MEPKNKRPAAEDIICPVCGYYCSGNGGKFCIDKPELFRLEQIVNNPYDHSPPAMAHWDEAYDKLEQSIQKLRSL